MYGHPDLMTEEDKQRISVLAPKVERRREAVLAATFNDIAIRASSFGAVPAESLLDQIETLCAECREVLATSKHQIPAPTV